jgi:hypothetical protein
VGGKVTISDSTDVLGDVVSVWGSLTVIDPMSVGGEQVEVRGFGGAFPIFDHAVVRDLKFLLLGPLRIVWVFFLIVIGVVVYQLFPSRMERLSDTVQRRGLVALLVGFIASVFWIPLALLLFVTLIGWPLLVLLFFLTPVMVLIGYLAVAETAGRRFGSRSSGPTAPSWRNVVVGVLILEGTLLIGGLGWHAGGLIGLLARMLVLAGLSIVIIAGTIGFGAFLMTRFRSMPQVPAPAAGAYPPPSGPPPPGSPPGDAR